jgi:hypothetical protein
MQGLDIVETDFPQVHKLAGMVEEKVDGKDGRPVADKERIEEEHEHD